MITTSQQENLRNEAVRHFLSNRIRRQLRASWLRLSCCNFSCEKKTKKSSSKPIEVLLVIITLSFTLKKVMLCNESNTIKENIPKQSMKELNKND